MKLKKTVFLKTELGRALLFTVRRLDKTLETDRNSITEEDFQYAMAWCQNRWEVLRIAIKQFYGVEYDFIRTEDYYGVRSEDGSDWLIKVYRRSRYSAK